MFVSRSEYRKAIKAAEERGMRKADEMHWQNERMERLERDMHRMREALLEEIRSIKAKIGLTNPGECECCGVTPISHPNP